jgi:alpha-amylase
VTLFRDLTGRVAAPVRTNPWGWGEFPVNGGSVSVWLGETPDRAPGKVLFVCGDAHTRPGQGIYVVGAIPELGEWDPARGVLLSPDPYPIWRAEIEVPTDLPFEWKCLKKEGAELVWQPGDNNLYLGADATTSGSF